MELEQRHIEAMDKAETILFHKDFCPYLELKELLPDSSLQARSRFRSLFTNYYGLNMGGLTDTFKNRFFEILFNGNLITNGPPDFPMILTELSSIPRKQGDCAMPFSFVSKLAAVHQEISPIYDRHVAAFFKLTPPAAYKKKQERIHWFVETLQHIAKDYTNWSKRKDLKVIIDRLRVRDPRLANCHNIRLIDFLVWKVGNQKLLQ